MPRKLIVMEEPETASSEEITAKMRECVDLLSRYLEAYVPESGGGFSKHAIMGPVGKLLGILVGSRFESEDAIIGYVVNIHKQTSRSQFVSPEILDLISKSVHALLELKKLVASERRWIKILREIDYSVYYQAWKKINERILAKKKKKEGDAK